MNEEMKNRTILVVTVVFLLITVVVMAFVFALMGEGKTKDVPKVSLKQLYSSEYELSFLNDAFFIGKYNGNMNTIIDNKGLEVISNIEVPFDSYYKVDDNEYLFYDLSGNNLNTYVFNGDTLLQKSSYSVNSSLKPIVFGNYIYGFYYIDGFKLVVIDINNSSNVVLNNLEVVGNYKSYIFVKNEDGKTGVIDIKGNVVIPFEYDSVVGSMNDTFIVSINDRKFLIDKNNNVLIDSSKNILNCNDIYLVLNDKNRIALFDNNIKMLTKYEIIYDDSLDVFKLDNNYVISLNDEFYFVNDRVTHYDGSFFEYNGSYAYYLNNVIYLVDNNLNVVKEISYSNDISIEDIIVFPFIISVKIMNGDIIEVKNYDYNFESVKAKENIVYKGANFFVYLNNKDDVDELIITDLRNDVIETVTGKNIVINKDYVLIDGSIYKIVAE